MKVHDATVHDTDGVPKQEDLVQALQMLQALRDPTRVDHNNAMRSLEDHVTNPSFVLVMLHIFSKGSQYIQQGLSSDLRQLSGLIIKNYVFPHLSRLPLNVQQILKKETVEVLHDAIPDIRKTAAILAGKISESFPVTTWADMVTPILQMLDLGYLPNQSTVVEGGLEAIQRICEDSAFKLALDDINRPLEALIPRLLALMTSDSVNIRIGALSSYNSLLILLSPRNFSSDSLRSRNSSFNDTSVDGDNAGPFLAHSNSNGDFRTFSPATTTSNTSTNNQHVLNPFPNHNNSSIPAIITNNAAHPLVINMNTFIQRLSQLSADQHPKVRSIVCQAITSISMHHVAVLDPYFADICQFMLNALLDAEESVAIESCEFWSVMVESPDTKRAILPYLKTLTEHLIRRLYLTSEQMEQERVDEEDENNGEKALNLRPIHHRTNSGTSSNGYGSSGSTTTSGGSGSGVGGGNGGSDDKENAELSAKWTLRKQAALLLDTVAISFPPADVLSFALPRIQEHFQSTDVLVKESGMLALGALSTGCLEEMAQYIPQLFPFLMQSLADPLPEMRSITCWVLSRFCGLFGEIGHLANDPNTAIYSAQQLSVLQQNHPEQELIVINTEGQQYYRQSLAALTTAMFDSKPKVQVAACSAMCVLAENSFYNSDPASTEENVLIEHLPQILTAINRAFDRYGIKASLLLVDSIGTIADTVRDALKKPEFTALYLPKLMQQFDSLPDDDMRLFPVLECMSSVLCVIGLEAQQYVLAIYQRCLRIATGVLQRHTAAMEHQLKTGEVIPEDELPCKDFAICSLDVISALCEGLGPNIFAGLVSGETVTRDLLFELLFAAISDSLDAMRQSGYSLTGEICKHAPSLLDANAANQIVQLAVRAVDSDSPLVCNNAAWTLGELALQVGGEFLSAFIPRMMNALINALQNAHLPDNIRVNLAVTIGRLAMVDQMEVAELANEYFADWCNVLEMACPYHERVHAYSGMVNVIHLNPHVLLNNKTNVYSLFGALVAWSPDLPPDDLRERFREILVALKANSPAMWDKVMNKFAHNYHAPLLFQLYGLDQ